MISSPVCGSRRQRWFLSAPPSDTSSESWSQEAASAQPEACSLSQRIGAGSARPLLPVIGFLGLTAMRPDSRDRTRRSRR